MSHHLLLELLASAAAVLTPVGILRWGTAHARLCKLEQALIHDPEAFAHSAGQLALGVTLALAGIFCFAAWGLLA